MGGECEGKGVQLVHWIVRRSLPPIWHVYGICRSRCLVCIFTLQWVCLIGGKQNSKKQKTKTKSRTQCITCIYTPRTRYIYTPSTTIFPFPSVGGSAEFYVGGFLFLSSDGKIVCCSCNPFLSSCKGRSVLFLQSLPVLLNRLGRGRSV